MRIARAFAVAVSACGVLASFGSPARGVDVAPRFEFAPVTEPPRFEDGTRLHAFAGLSVGFLSNPGRAAEADEESDGAAEVLGGVALTGGSTLLRYHAAAEARAGRFLDLGRFDYEEAVFRGGVNWATRRARLGLGFRHARLADPVEVDELAFPVLERRVTRWSPEAEFHFGGASVGVGYRSAAADYEDESLRYLDHSDWTAGLEVAWGRERASRWFARFEAGTVDYDVFDPVHPRADFDRRRLWGGWRSETARKQSLELGLGYYAVSGAGIDDAGLHVTARTTRMLEEGTSSLEAAYTRDAGPAVTADFKASSRVLVRYARQVNLLWSWSTAYRAEIADFVDPDPTTAGSLSVHALDLGVARGLGTPGEWRGRLHFRLSFEAGEDFDRAALLAGVSLVR